MFLPILNFSEVFLKIYILKTKKKEGDNYPNFCATLPTLTGRHGRQRPYIHIRSTPIGQQLPNLKSQKVTALYLAYNKMA